MKKYRLLFLILPILALAVLLAAVPAEASETVASGSTYEMHWVLTEDGTLTISGTGTIYGSGFFPYQRQILRVEIQEGLTAIYEGAFRNMTALTSVSLPESLTAIGFRAFAGCTALEQIRIPAGVKRIENMAFDGCAALKAVELQEGLEEIGGWAFSYCTALETITFPDTILSLCEYAFSGCSALTQVNAPDSPISLAANAFQFTPFLASITDSAGFAVWHGQLLNYSGTETALEIPASVTVISSNALYGSKTITSVTLPDALERIDQYAFANCTALTSITLPASVTLVESYAFYGCTSLAQVEYADASVFQHGAFLGTPFAQSHTDAEGFFVLNDTLIAYTGAGGEIRIPDSVRHINDDAFSGSKPITAITIPGTLEQISDAAFRDNRNLQSVILESGIRSIGAEAFCNCTNLTTVTLPEGLEVIGSGAFHSTGLSTVDIPSTVTTIGSEAFYSSSLRSLTGMEGIRSIENHAFATFYQAEISLPVTLEHLGESVFGSVATLHYGGTAQQFAQVQIEKGNEWLISCQLKTLSATPFRSNYGNIHRYQDQVVASNTLSTAMAKIDGGYMLAERARNGNIVAAKYDENYQLLSSWEIPLELPLYGGIYLDTDYNFVVSGQKNTGEDDTLEVIRITRYTSDWQRVDHVSVSGIRTRVPFDYGCLRFVRSGDHLFLRTARERYQDDEGVTHQTSLMLHIRISDMTLLEDLSGPTRPSEGYVSHSFDQYLLLDGDTLLAADLGDHTPRSVTLIQFRKEVGSSTLAGKANTVDMLPIGGTLGNNYTGVYMGGLSCSDTHYLVAGASVPQDVENWKSGGQKNIFISAVPKNKLNSDAAKTIWITDYTAGENIPFPIIHLVQLDGQRNLLMWSEGSRGFCCCILGPDGNPVSEIFRHSGKLNPCTPIFDGENVTWYTTGSVIADDYPIDSSPVFYTLDPEDLSTVTTHCPLHLYIGGICMSCGHENPCALGHSWTEATCKAPKTCSVCKATQGEPLAHRYENGICALCGRSEKGLLGDADGDGKVNYIDALAVLRHSIQLATAPFPENGEVDGKPGLSYQDALLILQFSIGLITEFPADR